MESALNLLNGRVSPVWCEGRVCETGARAAFAPLNAHRNAAPYMKYPLEHYAKRKPLPARRNKAPALAETSTSFLTFFIHKKGSNEMVNFFFFFQFYPLFKLKRSLEFSHHDCSTILSVYTVQYWLLTIILITSDDMTN